MISIVMFQCAAGLPLFLVWVVAGVMILQRAETHRTAAYLALGGIVLGVLDLVAGAAASAYTPLMVQQGASASTLSVALGAAGIARAIIGAISWALVLAALVMALGSRERRSEV